MKYLMPVVILLLFHTVVYCDFFDYRGFAGNAGPDEFEESLNISALYPKSAVIFTPGQPLLWEASGVEAISVKNSEIEAVVQEGMIYLKGGSCGSIIAPEGVRELSYNGLALVASTDDYNYYYFIPGCVEFLKTPRNGSVTAITDEYLCEADDYFITVTSLYDYSLLYRGQTEHPVLAIYAGKSACYFLDEEGNIFRYAKNGFKYFGFTWDAVQHATDTDSGFSGIENNSFFNLYISDDGILINYSAIPNADYCLPAESSDELLCAANYQNFQYGIAEVEKIYINSGEIYTLKEGILRAYSKKSGWVRQFVSILHTPQVYSHDGDLYLKDYLSNVYKLSEEGLNITEKVATLPEGAFSGGGYYHRGVVYSEDNLSIWKYADIIDENINSVLYKHEEKDKIIYIID